MATSDLALEAPIDLPPAHIAAGKNQVEKLTHLIQEGKEVVIDPNTRETVLHAAARNGAIKSAKWIVDSQTVDCSAYASNGYTAAHYAAYYGHLEVLKILLTQDDRKMESLVVTQTTQADENLSVLSLAAIGGYEDVVEWLLNNFGEKADVPTSKGRHAVHFAAAYGKMGVLTLLIQILGSDIVHLKDDQDTTPVFLAAQQGYLRVLSYLVNDLGADAEAIDKDGFNSVHAATQAGQTECVKWLVAKLGSRYIVSRTGKDGATPLHMAAGSGNMHLEILRYFLDSLDSTEDVNVTDHANYTPLHDAADEGVPQAVQLLLRHGARVDIKNKEKQTPYDLAMESGHAEVAALITDHLNKTGARNKKGNEKERRGPRTSRQETEELSTAIQQQAEVLEQRKEKQLSRQASLQDLGVEPSSTKDTTPLLSKKPENDDEIEHTPGPQGDLYANPKKLRNKIKGSSHQPVANDYDIEGFSSDPQSIKHQKQRSSPVEYEGPYAVINDSASMVSRDRRSRVRRHYGHDSDSEASGVTGRSGRPPHMPPGGWYPGSYEPMMFRRRGPRSVASSKQSSKDESHHSGYPPMMAPPPHMGYGYPYFAPYPQYWGHPQAYGMSTDSRMHMEMMQKHGQAPSMIPPGMSYGVYPHPRVLQAQARSNKQQKRKGKGGHRHQKSHDDMSAESSGFLSKKHTDQDIGYGPSIDTPSAIKEDYHDHPLAPPVTSPDGFMDESADVSKFSSNIIMSTKSDQVREVEGVTLNPSKAAPEIYDGRYDQFIMTDLEDDIEIEDYMNVGLLAEAAAILAIGCVAGLKGMSRIRKKNSSSVVADKHRPSERHGISSAWDGTYGYEPRKRSRRGSIDENIKGMSPEEFANAEDFERQTWDKDKPKSKKAKQAEAPKKGKDKKKSVTSTEAEVPNELITPELHKESYQSVSKHLGQKILTDALGAMHSSMLNIAPSSGMGSMIMSDLTKSASEGEGEGDDDDFGDTISLLEGRVPGTQNGRKPKSGDEGASGTEQSRIQSDSAAEPGKAGKKKKKEKKEKKSKTKEKKKDKEKKEKKSKKHSEQKSKKGKGEDEVDGKAAAVATPDKAAVKDEAAQLLPSVKPSTELEMPPQTKPVYPLGQPQPTSEKKAESQNLVQTPTTTANKEQPPPATEKKVYPKEKHPKVTKSPKFGQRLLTAPPKEKPPAKPEPVVKPSSEQKRFETKPVVTKPVESVISPHRKAPEPPVERASPKPKPKVPTQPPAKINKPQIPTKVPVKAATPFPKEEASSSREVINDVSLFDAESSEDEEPVPSIIKPKPTFIDDDMSKDIFGEEGLAELNEALRQLEDIQFSLNTDIVNESKPKATPSAMATGRESKRKGQQEQFTASSRSTSAKAEKDTDMINSIPQVDEMRLFSYEDGDLDFSDQDEIPSIPNGVQLISSRGMSSTMETQTQQSKQTSASQQTGGTEVQSTGVQGNGSYTSPFEKNVLSILQALNETMQQMKSNPSVSQTEINQHELLQQEMIQNLISFSQKDPEVIQKLLALLKDKQSPAGSDSNGALEDLQQKLVEAQERQRREASEHFKSQAEFQQEMQRRLEETAEMQMKGIQTNFDKYTKMMSEQMAEQMRRWEADVKKREAELERKEKDKKKHRSKGKKKKHRKHHYSETSETGSSSGSEMEGSGLIQPSAKVVVATKPAIKMDTAKIVRQDLLDDDMRTSSMPKVLAEKKQQMMKRRDTRLSFDDSRDALKRFESFVPPQPQVYEDSADDSQEDEDDQMQFQHARPITLKRADIKTQLQNTGYTPHRPQSGRAEKRVVPVRGEERPDHSDMAGAGDELAAVLNKRANNAV